MGCQHTTACRGHAVVGLRGGVDWDEVGGEKEVGEEEKMEEAE